MLHFGTIGTSWITEEYIHGATEGGLWKLTSVYSRTRERGEEFAKKHGASHVFTDLEEMASSPEIDAVYVASPNAFHYEYSKLFLEHGKHVICEKPVSSHASSVRELNRIAAERGLIFMEAIMLLHLPQLAIFEEAIKKIGDITLARIDFCQRSSKLDEYLAGGLPNIFNPQMEAGALMDLGVYCVYPALMLFGRPESFCVEPFMLKSGADGGGVITMKYPDKLVVLSYSKMGQAGANSDFQGTCGTVAVDSISRLAGISLIRRDLPPQRLYDGDEKHHLMGWEAKDFYWYITRPETSEKEYQYCSRLSEDVAEFMESVRKQAGIRFPSDGT